MKNKENQRGGYTGQGIYSNKTHPKTYSIWYSMLNRCYNKKTTQNPSYKHCSVSKEWKCFQNFAKWFDENYKESWHLDKDIIFKGNKIYSSETCCFVPREINNLFTKTDTLRGEYPIGVTKRVGIKGFRVRILIRNKDFHLGTFDTSEEAFQAYKVAKENYIKEIADEWRKQITEKVYEAMYKYEVEITD